MITIGVNNKQNAELHQEEKNGNIDFILRDHQGNPTQHYEIQPHELISLLNEYIHDNNL